MRFKLDENLGMRGFKLLAEAGFDVETVVSEQLSSASDEVLIEVCRAENRALISLDKDFSNILRYQPSRYAGIVVLRLPEPLQPSAIEDALRRMVLLLANRRLTGRLWIVDSERIREHAEQTEE